MSKLPISPVPPRGLVHVYTGDGKGKTTSAVGLTIRSAGAGHAVAFCQFDKGFEGRNEHYHERFVLRGLPAVDLFFFGEERMMSDGKFRFQNNDDDLAQARAGLAKAGELIEAGRHDLIVLDEAVTCVGTKLYGEDDLLGLVARFRERGRGDLVLTGRSAFPRLIEAADLVSDVTLVKHYFYQGVEARKGIEF